MTPDPKLISRLNTLFNPKSVAIVGLPRGLKAGKLFLIALLDQGFPGKIYPVHPEASQIDGLKTYPSVTAIPDKVDLAIILTPREHTLAVVKDCAAKGVKGAVLFTAGYRETGTDEGRSLEETFVRIARKAGMRLFGPNCMGIYAPKSGLSFFPELSNQPGPVGFISHSGSLANILGRMASQKGIFFSKAVSLGNECDLTSADFLHYLGNDPETGVIGAYLENISQGPYFMESLQSASRKKPVILWKVGLTPEGSQASNSHTGALGTPMDLWAGVIRQGGAIAVRGFEALVDAMMGFALLPSDLGDHIAILSGPGGLAVAAAEACGYEGLKLAPLTSSTRLKLSKFVPPTGTSLANPIDVGLTASYEMDIYVEAARTLAGDATVDALMVAGAGMTPELNERYTDAMIQVRTDFKKPVIIIRIPGFDPGLAERFCRAGLPFFDSVERATSVYAQIRRYQQWRLKESSWSSNEKLMKA